MMPRDRATRGCYLPAAEAANKQQGFKRSKGTADVDREEGTRKVLQVLGNMQHVQITNAKGKFTRWESRK